MILSHFGAQKSKMAAKIQDGGQKLLILLTKKLDMVLKNSHTENGAQCNIENLLNAFYKVCVSYIT